MTADGRVIAWGNNRKGQSDVPAELDGVRVVQVSAGLRHSLALTEGGRVVAWGANGEGQTDVPASLDGVRVTRIDAGAQHNLALTAGGAVVAWGSNDAGQCDVPSTMQGERFTRVAAGWTHSLAVTASGSLVAWGANRFGQSDLPRSLKGDEVSQIAAGDRYSLALTKDRALFAWGHAADGKSDPPTVLRGASVTRVVAGDDHNWVLARHRGPDLQITLQPQGRFLGNNFFSTRGDRPDIGGQAWADELWVKRSHVFKVRVYNDAWTTRTFRIHGSSAWVVHDASRPHWDPSLVRYYDGDADITSAMRSRRGVKVRIEPGDYRQYRVWLAVVPQFFLYKSSRADVWATRVGHPRERDRVQSYVFYAD